MRLAALLPAIAMTSCFHAHTISREEFLRLKKPDPLRPEPAREPGAPRDFRDFSTKVPAAPRARDTRGKEIEIDRNTSLKIRTAKGKTIEGLQPFGFTLTGTAIGQPQIVFRDQAVPLDSLVAFEVQQYDAKGTTAAWVAAAGGLFLIVVSTAVIALSN